LLQRGLRGRFFPFSFPHERTCVFLSFQAWKGSTLFSFLGTRQTRRGEIFFFFFFRLTRSTQGARYRDSVGALFLRSRFMRLCLPHFHEEGTYVLFFPMAGFVLFLWTGSFQLPLEPSLSLVQHGPVRSPHLFFMAERVLVKYCATCLFAGLQPASKVVLLSLSPFFFLSGRPCDASCGARHLSFQVAGFFFFFFFFSDPLLSRVTTPSLLARQCSFPLLPLAGKALTPL